MRMPKRSYLVRMLESRPERSPAAHFLLVPQTPVSVEGLVRLVLRPRWLLQVVTREKSPTYGLGHQDLLRTFIIRAARKRV